ncbi:putative F-box/kelch-repeat protein At4g22430 [Quercus robur]|uniref:putative F-box/kelch-repeat protein At4g22430 n=1 Tax=Quercus robur TaxID=38942 RepID=UPI002163B99B|nr:putative F-box/kelch-repeat protein At4g22430 [Quercus robur]
MSLSKSSTDLSLLPLRKRRKENPTQSSEPLYELINKLPDALLSEIFYRLPCRSAFQFKSVSKRWFSLISDPYFVRGFIHHRHQFSESNSSDSNSDPFTLVLQNCFSSTKNFLDLLVFPSDNSGDCVVGDDVLNFLPCIKRGVRKDYHYIIRASFNDLLLLYREVQQDSILNFEPGFCEYCICNPLTKQWITLPHLPLPIYSNLDDVIVGFICDPYSCDNEQECKTHAHYRYKVVRFHPPTHPNTKLHMHIFSSDTGEWCNSVVSLPPRGLTRCSYISKEAGVVACNGMMHLANYTYEELQLQGIVVFDPFNDAERCGYIETPISFPYNGYWSVSLCVFRGHLRIIHQYSPSRYMNQFLTGDKFSIWELEDYDNGGRWCLKHEVYIADMVLKYPNLANLASLSPMVLLPAFHPNDDKIFFFNFRNYILMWDLQTMVLKVAIELENTKENIVDNSKSLVLRRQQHLVDKAKSVFLLQQQSWPTPVPPLPLKFE